MDAITCITTRKSIRGFKPDPVPPDLLREIFAQTDDADPGGLAHAVIIGIRGPALIH